MKLLHLALAFAYLATAAFATAQSGIIYGTGTAGNGQRDTNWLVLAVGGNNVSGNTLPYDSYVYTVVPQSWNGTGGFGQPQVGITNADGTFRWIGPNPTPSAPFPADYNYIIGQSFIAEVAGNYNFSFQANGDNLFSFFINGNISFADPVKPTMPWSRPISRPRLNPNSPATRSDPNL